MARLERGGQLLAGLKRNANRLCGASAASAVFCACKLATRSASAICKPAWGRSPPRLWPSQRKRHDGKARYPVRHIGSSGKRRSRRATAILRHRCTWHALESLTWTHGGRPRWISITDTTADRFGRATVLACHGLAYWRVRADVLAALSQCSYMRECAQTRSACAVLHSENAVSFV